MSDEHELWSAFRAALSILVRERRIMLKIIDEDRTEIVAIATACRTDGRMVIITANWRELLHEGADTVQSITIGAGVH